MDATASPRVDANLNGVYGFYLQIENSTFQTPVKHKNTVIKYTKLPDFDVDSKVSWPEKRYPSQPRLRRIVTLEEPPVVTSRSLKSDLNNVPIRTMSSSLTKRKIVTIEEDDENDLHPKFSREKNKLTNIKSSSKAAETEFKNEKHIFQRTTSRLTNSSKYSKESKTSAKNINTTTNKKDLNTPKVTYKSKYSNATQPPADVSKTRSTKESARSRVSNASSKISLSKNYVSSRESDNEISAIKVKLMDNVKTNTTNKKPVDKSRFSKPVNHSPTRNTMLLKELAKHKPPPCTVIHVPLDNKYSQEDIIESESHKSLMPLAQELESKVDCGTEIDRDFHSKDVTTGTDSQFSTEDKETQLDKEEASLCRCLEQTHKIQTELIEATYDSLAIPNVTLTKDKTRYKEQIVNFQSKSLPNLQVPPLKMTPAKSKEGDDSSYCKSAYFISHATVTCTTRQKINFHVVGNNRETVSNQSTSPLAYPINVVSIFEKDMKKQQHHDSSFDQDKSNAEYTNCLNELHSLNCSYVLNSNKFVKPSDLISTIRVNNSLLQSDFICEQFQRELNFVDSFFESLQYLESCSLSEKCLSEGKVKSLVDNTDFDVNHSEYGSFFAKLENGGAVDDSETMASKSLCLLNLLIRDEQRRAKNLLFVLKMREDALKDFTKSQILWLENKKRQENTDISTLKKKQRGALLKLQHECGEMQRMRKALLTQSEKRKVALIKTKKNIELKLKNNVEVVDQIILNKRKLKRNPIDRNTTPLKCFDLSSSGCEESFIAKAKSEIALPETFVASVTSAEKCIQTGDSILEVAQVDGANDTAAANIVVVDGGYLNILFHNLTLPEIFSNGKQYEVNEGALKNILSSTTNTNQHFNETDILERFMNQIKNPDLDTSSPSTARSLVEEMDQYYKVLVEEKMPIECATDSHLIYEVKETGQALDLAQCDIRNVNSASTMASDDSVTVLDAVDPFARERICICEVGDGAMREDAAVLSTAGPLPVPAGEAAATDQQGTDVALWDITKSPNSSNSDASSVSSEPNCSSGTSMSSMTSPVHCEAEELRRQQLAIEREIKALEQQQCQLLVVREIPDKPPPPYTPPVESRQPRLPRMYVADETTEEKIHKYIRDPTTDSCDPTDAFDTFVKDFCIETLERHKSERSDKPWHSYNLLPQKPPEDTEKLIKKTSSNLLEILVGVTPPVISGVGARRSDHVDDVLFAEWRRCEPEWTSLHADESLVKNQIFESIFQKILTETIDEYKRTVLE